MVAGALAAFVWGISQVVMPAWHSVERDSRIRESYLLLNSFRSAPLLMSGAGSLTPHSDQQFLERQLDQVAHVVETISGQATCVAIHTYQSTPLSCNPFKGKQFFSASQQEICSTVSFQPDSCLGNAVFSAIVSSGCSSESYFLAITPKDESLRNFCMAIRLEGSVYDPPVSKVD